MMDREALVALWRGTAGKDVHGRPVPRGLVAQAGRHHGPGGQILPRLRSRKPRSAAFRFLIPDL